MIDIIEQIIDSSDLAVLATCQNHTPLTSLMAYAADLKKKTVVMATDRDTMKFGHLTANPKASILMDTRLAAPAREDIRALTIDVELTEISTPKKREKLEQLLLDRNPHLADFLAAPTCELLNFRMKSILLVTAHFDTYYHTIG